MRIGSTAAALLGAAALVAATAAPAAATLATYTWLSPCSAGTASTASLRTVELGSHSGGALVTATGTVTPCHAPAASDRFGVAVYRNQSSTEFELLSYSAAPGFTATVPTMPGVVAVCVIASPNVRLACAAMPSVTNTPQPAVPIATDDPRVSVPVVLYQNGVSGSPGCPNCWS